MKRQSIALLLAVLVMAAFAPGLYAKTGIYEEYQDPIDVKRYDRVYSLEHLDLTVREAEQAAETACEEAEAAGADRAVAKVWGIGRATKDALDAMVKVSRMPLTLVADSRDPDNGVNVRMTLDPSAAQSNIHLFGSTLSANAQQVKTHLQNRFGGTLSVIELGQQGNFGLWVQMAAKADLAGLNTTALRLYSYSPSTGALTELSNQEHRIDESGYLHFSTWQGDYIVISDRSL